MIKQQSSAPERMACMEIRGGNRAISKQFEAPGVDLHVFSSPFRSDEHGGDIYYITSCASGRISRILLADVSGHGEGASKLALKLRDLLRSNVNTIGQDRFMEALNREFSEESSSNGFATAAVLTFFEPQRKLSIGLAGHPYPFFYQAKTREWSTIELARSEKKAGDNIPLGVLEDATYAGRNMRVENGDMVLLYSDAFTESQDSNGKYFGMGGILELLNRNPQFGPQQVIACLRESVLTASPNVSGTDDATLILAHFTRQKVSLRDNLLAPFRLLRKVRDRTEVR